MAKFFRTHGTESALLLVIAVISLILSLITDRYFTIGNAFDLLNTSSVNIIFAVGLLVVLISGGIDISFAVAASVVQYGTALFVGWIGGGDWAIGLMVAGGLGILLGSINAGLIQAFGIPSIVVSISSFNAFFGLLMFFTKGVSIYDLPDWLTAHVVLYERQLADGSWIEISLPVLVMVICVVATWALVTRTTIGRQLYAFGDNPEGARRAGISIPAMQALAFGWSGFMAGIAGLMQVNIVQEVVPNALYGRELEVLAAVVLGGARLGGGRGTITGCALGVMFVAVTQNGLNLLGVSPFAFQMIIGAAILIAISTSNISFGNFGGSRAEARK